MVGATEFVIGLLVFAAIAVMPTAILSGAWRCLRGVGRPAPRRPQVSAPIIHLPPCDPTAVGRHRLKTVRVIDGDTVQDMVSLVRYRVENIDAPETGKRALCFRERAHGEIAKTAAEKIVMHARAVYALPIGRLDAYGRVVARLEVDGQDFGTIMIQRGFARPWGGERERWCGPEGGLAMMARARSAAWKCKTCKNWRPACGKPDSAARFVNLAEKS